MIWDFVVIVASPVLVTAGLMGLFLILSNR